MFRLALYPKKVCWHPNSWTQIFGAYIFFVLRKLKYDWEFFEYWGKNVVYRIRIRTMIMGYKFLFMKAGF